MSGRPASTAASEACRLRVVVLVGTGQRHDQPARDVVGEAVHVVDLSREQQLADVGEDGVRLDACPDASLMP